VMTAMRTLGLDFTSSSSSAKANYLAEGTLDADVLHLASIRRLGGPATLGAVLHESGPWVLGIDFPFGLPEEFVDDQGWGRQWVEYATQASALSYEDFRKRSSAPGSGCRTTRHREALFPGAIDHLLVDLLAVLLPLLDGHCPHLRLMLFPLFLGHELRREPGAHAKLRLGLLAPARPLIRSRRRGAPLGEGSGEWGKHTGGKGSDEQSPFHGHLLRPRFRAGPAERRTQAQCQEKRQSRRALRGLLTDGAMAGGPLLRRQRLGESVPRGAPAC
jgi:hypothetical protein